MNLADLPRRRCALAVAIWALLVAAALASRPYLPIDETRYVAVAWEMWNSGEWLLPHKNGVPYADKPPLMFWLINAGWLLTGPNEWWPRVVVPLFSLAALLLTGRVAKRLWPGREDIAGLACLVLASFAIWDAYTAALMFDTMVTTFVLVVVLAALHASSDGRWRWWLIAGAALGLGLLAKGPIVLLHALPLTLVAPWWVERPPPGGWRRWYRGIGLAVAVGSAIALAWAIPAAHAGGRTFARAIFWGQTAERMVDAFKHKHAFYWYLPLLPLLFFPWIAWSPVWHGVRRALHGTADVGLRAIAAWASPTLLGLSAISGKQIHYLIPLAPATALLTARLIASRNRAGETAVEDTDGLRPYFIAFLLLAFAGLLALSPSLRALSAYLPDDRGETVRLTAAMLWVIGIALALARPRSTGRAAFTLGSASVAAFVALTMGPVRAVYDRYDVAPTGHAIGALAREGHPVAYVGHYHDQYQFFGRLARPLEEIEEDRILAWARTHRDGVVVALSAVECRDGPDAPIHSHPYLAKTVCIYPASAFLGGEGPPPGSGHVDPSHV